MARWVDWLRGENVCGLWSCGDLCKIFVDVLCSLEVMRFG